jgi:hypothetical protein
MDGQTGFGRLNVFWRDNKQRPEEWSIEPPGVVPEKLKKVRGDVDDTVY